LKGNLVSRAGGGTAPGQRRGPHPEGGEKGVLEKRRRERCVAGKKGGASRREGGEKSWICKKRTPRQHQGEKKPGEFNFRDVKEGAELIWAEEDWGRSGHRSSRKGGKAAELTKPGQGGNRARRSNWEPWRKKKERVILIFGKTALI